MICFSGILNENGKEKPIKIYLDLDANEQYVTNLYIDNIKTEAHVTNNVCLINGSKYYFIVRDFHNEIIVAAQESIGIIHLLCSCVCSRNYFVVSNKDDIPV